MAEYSRKLNHRPTVGYPLETANLNDPTAWLIKEGTSRNLQWLLAHTDDGVVWGCMRTGELVTSHEAARDRSEADPVCPPLRAATLLQARLFSLSAELLLWRREKNVWQARVIEDETNQPHVKEPPWKWHSFYDEEHLLWGTHGIRLPHSFTLLRDGAQGLRHAVPCTLALGTDGSVTPPRLMVRHYLNSEGYARVVASRLCDLKGGSCE